MARTLGYLLAFAVIGYGLWPYYTIFRLDTALAGSDPNEIAPYVDVPAIQESYRRRLDGAADAFLPKGGDSDSERAIAWLAENLKRLGEGALDQAITLAWARSTLREAAARASDTESTHFIAGIDFAFFESWDRFVIRLGELGRETHVVMGLEGGRWRVVDIVR
ncbi:MAG: DUF2939 domain-containing protein [Thiohalocapsa sp.]|jgi:hypothetical protein